jgi:ribonuclease HI
MPKNPGGTAKYAYQILDENDHVLVSHSAEVCRGPEATNNLAEWNGVLNALRYLKLNNWSGKLKIIGDSMLVINQLNGVYKVRKNTLVPLHAESISILNSMDWSADWVPREENQQCDKLSKSGN